MDTYQAHVLECASGVELTIALYDGIVRFMNKAIDAVEQGDADQRRAAVKRAMDIVMHLQVTLDRRQGGKPAEALSEFYTAMFALMLQGSQANARQKFEQVIANVRNVREAWKQVLVESPANGISISQPVPPQNANPWPQTLSGAQGGSWTA
jgi:flagellar secretion chaperone FliS